MTTTLNFDYATSGFPVREDIVRAPNQLGCHRAPRLCWTGEQRVEIAARPRRPQCAQRSTMDAQRISTPKDAFPKRPLAAAIGADAHRIDRKWAEQPLPRSVMLPMSSWAP